MATTPDAAPVTPEERAAAREARRADNRTKHLAKQRGWTGPKSETPEFDSQQRAAFDDLVQSIGGPDKGLTISVHQITPQRHGESMGRPAHVLDQPYSPGLTEADLKTMAIQSGSADPGTFELRFIRDGKVRRIVHTTWRWKVDAPANGAPAGLAIRETLGIAKDMKDLAGGSGLAPIDVPALINAVNRPAAGNPVMDEAVKALILRALAPPPDPLATIATTAQLLETLKPTPAPAASPLDAIKGLGEMLTTVKALAGGFAPEAPAANPWIEFFRLAASALAPLAANIPAMWQMAQQTRAAELEHRKRETLALYVRAGVPLEAAAKLAGVALPPLAFGSAPPGRQESPAAEPEAPPARGPQAGPLAAFASAIEEGDPGDPTVFPALAEAITGLPGGIGPTILDGLATDPNALSLLRAKIDASGGRAYFAELYLPGADAFFAAFGQWLQQQGAAS